MTFTAADAHAAAVRGAAWLDNRCPDWHREINLEILKLRSPESCVLGQTAECLIKDGNENPWSSGYWRVVHHYWPCAGESMAVRYGFTVTDLQTILPSQEIAVRFEMLEIAWLELIRARLEAEVVPA